MLRSKWLYVAGLVITAPIVLVLLTAAADQLLTRETVLGWRSGGGKAPAGAATSWDVILIAGMAAAVWILGVAKTWAMGNENPDGAD